MFVCLDSFNVSSEQDEIEGTITLKASLDGKSQSEQYWTIDYELAVQAPRAFRRHGVTWKP